MGMLPLLTLLLAARLGLGYQKISMFVGIDPDSGYGFEIRAYPDIVREFTLISSNDFKCVEKTKCVLDGTKRVMTFLNRTIVYYDAAAQLNIIKQPFAHPFNFRFIADDVDNIGSWVGISPNSTYLKYLYEQDQHAGYRIIFRLTWDNEMTYRTGVFEGDKILLPAQFNAVQTVNNGGLVSHQNLVVCLNNRLDMATKGLSMFGVPTANISFIESLNRNWAAQGFADEDLFNITWAIYDKNGFNVGNITLNHSDLNVNSTFRVKAFTPEFDNGRKCDVYTGSLLLKKMDFKFYYIEYDAGFDVRFSMEGFVTPPPPPVEVTWPKILKIVLICLVAAIVGLMVWFNLCSTGHGLQFFNFGDPADQQNPAEVALMEPTQPAVPGGPMMSSQHAPSQNQYPEYNSASMNPQGPPQRYQVPPPNNYQPAMGISQSTPPRR